MKLIADATIELPFALDFCAVGPDVAPLTCAIAGMEATLYFPPSLGEGTDGKGIFGDWAWWIGRRLRLVLEREVDSVEDTEALREAALTTGNELLRRFLNAYRVRFRSPGIHPVRIDTRALTLEIIGDDGNSRALTEPFAAFFYRDMPQSPPLDRSVNAQTLENLRRAVCAGEEPSLATQLTLDADALDAQGEPERAALVRQLANEVHS